MSNMVFQVELCDRTGKTLVTTVNKFVFTETGRSKHYHSDWLEMFAQGIRDSLPSLYRDLAQLNADRYRDIKTLERYLLGDSVSMPHLIKQSGTFERYVIFESIWDASIARFYLNRYNIGAAFYAHGSWEPLDADAIESLSEDVVIATADPDFVEQVRAALCRKTPEVLSFGKRPDDVAAIGWAFHIFEFRVMNALLALWDESPVTMSRQAKIEVEVPARREQLMQLISRYVPGCLAEKYLLEHATLSDQIKPLQRMLDTLLLTLNPVDRVAFWRWAVMCVPELSEEEKFMPQAILGQLEGTTS